MRRDQKIALATVGISMSVLCFAMSHTVRFAFPFASADFTRGFFIGVGIVAAVFSTASLVALSVANVSDAR